MNPETIHLIKSVLLCSSIAGLVFYRIGHWRGWNDRNNAGDLD